MRRRPAAVLATGLAVLAAAGCGGTPVDQVRHVAGFDRLLVTGGVHVSVARGPRPGVTVHGRSDVLGRVVTESAGGQLHVGIRDRGIVIGHDPLDDVRVRLVTPRLHDVGISGSGSLDLGDVHADALRFTLDGAGEVFAAGRVNTLSATVHGAAHADFSRLAARSALVEIHGASDMQLDVTDRLDVQIRGAGAVGYHGHPRVTQDIAGAGEVHPIGP